MIYFIHCPAQKAIKIGHASDPEKRLSGLQTGCPDQLILLVTIPGGPSEEAVFHSRFKDVHLRGEWFRESSDLMDEINRHRFAFRPAKGTNPECLPAPDHGLIRSFREDGIICPELCYITSLAVGHAVSIYKASSDGPFFEVQEALIGTREAVYQVMRWDEDPGDGLKFWRHHVWERPQWYYTPEEACAAYVASYVEWRNAGGET